MILLIQKKVNARFTMYVMIGSMYIYFYYLLNESPYLVNYFFMWLALPLSAIYQQIKAVLMAGVASIILTFYSFFYLHDDIFPNVIQEDFIYLVLFGIFITIFLIVFILKVREANDKLQDLAYHDPLTGAANRSMLKEKFDLMKHENVDSLAVLFLDMNGFKKINDTYGHEVGDQLLQIIVLRIDGVLRETDLLCRLGGDEFVILTANINQSIVKKITDRIKSALEKPMILDQYIIHVSASIGSYFTIEVLDANLDEMIKEADRAMYKEKELRGLPDDTIN
ncbi:GGDEF domain-containing protein [Solibacillus isronensis]|uniref:GGDEF domain-containing protein n=1 Tax=Solibacillus isronensis TaxID=412383 RepID=UPI00203E1BB3|nr:GGDEF domain-containing protein [Solibacillus isronensis]MCM3721713.1 GGDEF domain-containing protein [Solibacillus isronensis]